MEPPQSYWFMFVSLVIIVLFSSSSSSSCFSQSSSDGLFARAHASTLIQEACNRSRFTDLCIISLESDPRSINADLKGLAFLTIDIAKANATAILAYINNELIGNSTSRSTNVSVTRCQQEYQDAIGQLDHAIVSFNDQAYHGAMLSLSDTETDIDSCKSDESIVVQDVPPLLVQMSEIAFRLCSNAIAVLCKYSADIGVEVMCRK